MNAISPAFAAPLCCLDAHRTDLACGGSFGVVAILAGVVRSRIEVEAPKGGAREVVEVSLTADECRAIARRYLRAAEEAGEAELRASCPGLPGFAVLATEAAA